MPTFSTGNTAWDQGLGNLSGALFPDPSKVAQAGYYGAEQRKAQLESSKLRDQMARQQVLDQAANTLTMPAETYAPSPEGPNMPPIMQPPGAAAPPAPAPPSLSATVAPGPAAAAPPPPAASAAPAYNPPIPPPPSTPASPAPPGTPSPGPPSSVTPAALNAAGPMPPPAPTQAGTVGANMTPAGLSSLFAQGGGAVPDGGGTVRLDQGTPPPVSSPAQGSGAPPAPNNTASDGSVPTNDAVSGVFHPGSITPPGGGTKTTGPANANGSPAQPMITAAQYVNMAVSAGRDANQALLQWRSMISTMYDTGRIDENTYHHMMGSADPSIINQDTSSRTSIATTGMTNQASRDVANINAASAANVANIGQAGQDRRAPPTFVPDEGAPGTGKFVPPQQIQQSGGMRGGSPQPLSQDQTAAMIQQQIINEPDPAKRAELIQRYQAASPRPPPDEKEVYAARAMNYQSDQEAYPTPQKPPVAFSITAPIALRGDAQAAVNARAQSLMDQNRRLDLASAHQQAVFQLQNEGTLYTPDDVNAMRQGTAANLYGRYDAQIQNYAPPGGKPSEHLMVGLKPKGGGGQQQQAAPPGQTQTPPVTSQAPPASTPPPGPAYRPLADIVGNAGSPPPAPGTPTGPPPVPFFQKFLSRPATTGPTPLTPMQMYGGVPPAAAAAPPPAPALNQPIARAAPNQRDGDIAYLNGRPIGIVRGGAVYPMPAQAGPGGGG